MKHIGHIRELPIEKIGFGKWVFRRYLDGKIRLYQTEDEEGNEMEKLVQEFEDVEDLKERGRFHNLYGADLSFVCKYI